MTKTAHSEYDRLQVLYLMPPQIAFRNQPHIRMNWKALNFHVEPDYEHVLEAYKIFEELISTTGCEIRYFSEASSLDDLFCRDASIATNYGVILCNMGKVLRSAEPKLQRTTFEAYQEKILGQIIFPGIVEGGDVAWIDTSTLAVGQGYRTNKIGLSQLTKILAPFSIELIQVELPHYKGPDDVFHLMSIFSPVDQQLAVVYSRLMPVSFRNILLEKGYTLIEVPDEEFESMGCNVLAIGPSECIIVSGNPITKYRLEQNGVVVHEYPGKHLSLPGGGGPTCLTRPRWRMKSE